MFDDTPEFGFDEIDQMAEMIRTPAIREAVLDIADREGNAHAERYRNLMSNMMMGMFGHGMLSEKEMLELTLYTGIVQSGNMGVFGDVDDEYDLIDDLDSTIDGFWVDEGDDLFDLGREDEPIADEDIDVDVDKLLDDLEEDYDDDEDGYDS